MAAQSANQLVVGLKGHRLAVNTSRGGIYGAAIWSASFTAEQQAASHFGQTGSDAH